MEGDLLLALQLQAAWAAEDDGVPGVGRASPAESPVPLSVVDESWELIDPNPDLRGLFLQFNDMFFWGRLAGVEVRWSPRMTLCAGLCCYEGRGGLCSVRISEPLLKLRPRRDLVETLLHEMIHALLFVTNNDKDHDSHGPEFCKHMNRINKMSGTKITIYHNFHDEIDVYRQHWWRCDGPCQNRRPYYGYVKRAMNRAPSARDPWWAEHQLTCGGTFTKIKEPENYKAKKGKGEGTPGHLSRPSKDKGKSMGVNISTVIPFSGKGHILKGSSPNSAVQHVSAGNIPERLLARSSHSVPWASESPLRFRTAESNGQEAAVKASSSSNSLLSDLGSPGSPPKSQGAHPSSKLTKKSVSNSKAFVSIDGSPVRISSAMLMNTVKKVPKGCPKRPISDLDRSPLQRDRGDEKKARPDPSFPRGTILHAFGKLTTVRQGGQSTGASISSEADSENLQSPKGAAVLPLQASASGGNDSNMPVNCPVCQSAVLASEINQHLDLCLQ
ncbi:DNA-dependent metalloprotease SPRTN [Hemitrygon akajei]|uniref:DNA-dependent metalloprotease SPRTN n=1 Tax=Hemitrygon akajei TaxID=2704970 RepID=UPI003BFA3204